MRAYLRLEILIGLLLLVPAMGAEAADEFEHVGTIGGQIRHVTPNARALAMGGAFTAIADGAAAAWWNPGALGMTSGPWIAEYSTRELLPGNDFRLHWVGLTGKHEGIGLGGHVTKFEDEYVGILASGVDVARYVEEMPEGVRLGIGTGLTAYQEDYGAGDVRSWDMDLGALFEWESPVEGGRHSYCGAAMSCGTSGIARSISGTRTSCSAAAIAQPSR